MDGQEAAFFDDDEPARPLLPPEDRLWRHPSELAMFPPPRRRHRPSISPLVIAPLVVVGVAGALIVAIVVAGPSTSRNRLRPSEAASVTPLTVSSIVSAVSAVPTIAPLPATTVAHSVTTMTTTAPVSTMPPTTDPVEAVAAPPSSEGSLSDGSVTIPAVDLHDRFVVAAFDVAPKAEANWTLTDAAGVSRPAHLVGYVPAVRLAVLSVDLIESDDPSARSELPEAPWFDEPLMVGTPITINGLEGALVAVGNKPTADGLALEHALVAENPSVGHPSVGGPSVGDPSVGDIVWSDGKIVGLVVHRSEGHVLVIPSNLVTAAAASVIGGSTTELAWLGVSVTSNDRSEIVVSAVNPASPAASIGLRVGDIIGSVNGTDIGSPASLVAEVWRCGAGHAAEITVTRGDETFTLVGELAAMPVDV